MSIINAIKKISFLKPITTLAIRTKRLILLNRGIILKNIPGMTENLSFIGIVKYFIKESKESTNILYPLLSGFESLFKEIFDDNVYLKYFTLEKDNIVIDAGANIGVFSLLAASLIKNTGEIICIEPDPQNIRFIKLNREINKKDNIKIIEKATWSEKTLLEFNISKLNPTASSVYADSNDRLKSKKIKVETETIDNIAMPYMDNEKNIFLKMDIEGAEVEVIKSMKRILAYKKIKGVIAAYHKIKDDKTKKEMPSFKAINPILKESGFKTIVENGIIYFWR